MNKIKQAKASIGTFVENHKVGIAVISTAVICLKINRIALRSHDDFLKEHDLFDKFYTPSDEE